MEDNFISFLCPKCNIEIQASADMIGQKSECPACGAEFVIPDTRDDGVLRHGADEMDPDVVQKMKRRTIRIDLSDL